ncbi:MAG: gamma-glutamyl-gamma-aminobutyrate hydrolase family protein [Prevotellaceae bacterium]|nr:gamma-glutamyl-gamma-aminobutyrate hydrolase family protein [Prevotellaceae bacterium]
MRRIKITALLLLLLLPLPALAQGNRPVIGISSDCKNGKLKLSETYTKAVLRAGGIPLVLPQVEDSLTATVVLEAVDGLILSGGEDINPLLYGEQPQYGLGDVNPARDLSELLWLKVAHARGLPVLGICRGQQFVNVFYGGTLYQDLPSQHEGNPLNHLQSFGGTEPSHLIYIVKGSHLSQLLAGVDSVFVNSFHHQAVKALAPGFRVAAQSPDGVVEAIEGLPGLNVVAVQFHPEFFAMKGDERWLPVFRDLVARAAAYKEK